MDEIRLSTSVENLERYLQQNLLSCSQQDAQKTAALLIILQMESELRSSQEIPWSDLSFASCLRQEKAQATLGAKHRIELFFSLAKAELINRLPGGVAAVIVGQVAKEHITLSLVKAFIEMFITLVLKMPDIDDGLCCVYFRAWHLWRVEGKATFCAADLFNTNAQSRTVCPYSATDDLDDNTMTYDGAQWQCKSHSSGNYCTLNETRIEAILKKLSDAKVIRPFKDGFYTF